MNTVEIIYGDSLFYTMKNTLLSENKIIQFNTLFDVSDLKNIKEYKLSTKEELSSEPTYDFSKQMKELNNCVKKELQNKNLELKTRNKFLYVATLYM